MALFTSYHQHGPRRHNGAAGNIVTADLMRRQQCHRPDRHVFPVPMEHVRVELNRHQQPTTVWRCPACGRQRGIAKNFKTGAPFTLWEADRPR